MVVLVVEVILGATANLSEGMDRTYLIIGMLGLIFSLVIIVAGFAYFRPESLRGERPVPESPKTDVSPLSPSVESINKPKFFLASASQGYTIPYIEDDERITGELFQKRQIKVYKSITAAQFRDLLTDNHYDILHLTIPVDKENGSLVFDMKDTMSTQAFSQLIEISGARLVVLAICDSMMLAARISNVTNMIAAFDTIVDENDFLAWEHTFYKMLSLGHPLSRAFDHAKVSTNTPMTLIMKKDFTVVSE